MIGEVLCILGRIQAKWGIGWQVWFVSYCKRLATLGREAQSRENVKFLPSFKTGNSIPQLLN